MAHFQHLDFPGEILYMSKRPRMAPDVDHPLGPILWAFERLDTRDIPREGSIRIGLLRGNVLPGNWREYVQNVINERPVQEALAQANEMPQPVPPARPQGMQRLHIAQLNEDGGAQLGNINLNPFWAGEPVVNAGPEGEAVEPPLSMTLRNNDIRIGLGQGTFQSVPGDGLGRVRRRQDGTIFEFDAADLLWKAIASVEREMIAELDTSQLLSSEDRLAPFKLPYQTVDEAHSRLVDSIIRVKNKAFLVWDVSRHGRKDFKIYLRDQNDKDSWIAFSDEHLNLRSINPGYVHNDNVSYMIRTPGRVFKQGLTTNNAQAKVLGDDRWRPFRSTGEILLALNGRKQRRLDEPIIKHMKEGLITGLYLNDNVAVFRNKKDIAVEYKGRALGLLRDNVVTIEEDDFDQSWIQADLAKANIEARRA